jgi:hypothetical protein
MRGFLFTFPVLCQQPSYIKFVRNSQPYLFIVVKTMMDFFFAIVTHTKVILRMPSPIESLALGVLEYWSVGKTPNPSAITPILQYSNPPKLIALKSAPKDYPLWTCPGVLTPLIVYPELTFSLSCLTVREDITREENVEVKAKGGNSHA